MKLTPEGHSNKPSRLTSLGNAIYLRYIHHESPLDLENAISLQKAALEILPDVHPVKPSSLYGLGISLKARIQQGIHANDMENAVSAFSAAALSSTGPAMTRFDAACAWAYLCWEYEISSIEAFECAIGLLSRIAWLGLSRKDQYALLAQINRVVRDAVAAAIQSKRLELAVEWAEQGRAIVWQNMLGLRDSTEDLQTSHPDLAMRLQNISRQMEKSAFHDISSTETDQISLGEIALVPASQDLQ